MEDEIRLDYCTKCLDDHEDRIRIIEKNDKEAIAFRAEMGKLEVRIDALEKYMDGQLAVINSNTRSKTDIFGIAALFIAIAALILNILKL